jgi:hypothetical protein
VKNAKLAKFYYSLEFTFFRIKRISTHRQGSAVKHEKLFWLAPVLKAFDILSIMVVSYFLEIFCS